MAAQKQSDLLQNKQVDVDVDVDVEAEQVAEYRAPQVIAVGRAIDLLQGGQGKHQDSYSGYYRNKE